MNKSIVKLIMLKAQVDGTLERISRERALADAYNDPELHDMVVEDITAMVREEEASGKCAECDSNNNCILKQIANNTFNPAKVVSVFGFTKRVIKMQTYIHTALESGRTREEISADLELNAMLEEVGLTSDILR